MWTVRRLITKAMSFIKMVDVRNAPVNSTDLFTALTYSVDAHTEEQNTLWEKHFHKATGVIHVHVRKPEKFNVQIINVVNTEARLTMWASPTLNPTSVQSALVTHMDNLSVPM